MTGPAVTESVVEQAALTWLATTGFAVAHAPRDRLRPAWRERSDPHTATWSWSGASAKPSFG